MPAKKKRKTGGSMSGEVAAGMADIATRKRRTAADIDAALSINDMGRKRRKRGGR